MSEFSDFFEQFAIKAGTSIPESLQERLKDVLDSENELLTRDMMDRGEKWAKVDHTDLMILARDFARSAQKSIDEDGGEYNFLVDMATAYVVGFECALYLLMKEQEDGQ